MAKTELPTSWWEPDLASARRMPITGDPNSFSFPDAPLSGGGGHLVRPRINALLAQAIKNPLTVVCGGMGYGKTRAVHDFARECDFPVMWLHFPGVDEPNSHFWEMLLRSIAQINKPYAKELKKLGLPSTRDMLNMFFDLRKRMQPNIRRLYVVDDFHLIKNAAALSFVEQAVNTLPKDLPSTSVILISREFPSLNFSSLMIRDNISLINEDALNFTESELHQFLLQQGLNSETSSLSSIYEDTRGWAFIINFVARILKKTPGYMGHARKAIQQDISQLIEAEAWNTFSERLKHFLLRLSLTKHHAMDLVNVLAGKDESLISEFKKQNAFIYRDGYTDCFHIHYLFLDFLRSKQSALTDDEIRDTYKTVADWCVRNDFIVDALFKYEKIGDYEAIVSVLSASPVEFLQKNSRHIVKIFNRAPAQVFDRVELSAAIHAHLLICAGQWLEGLALLRHYETKYLGLPEDSGFRNRMLGYIYYLWGVLRMALSAMDDCYDFDIYFAKHYECVKNFPLNPKCWYQHPANLWTSFVSSTRAGAPQEYISALTRSMDYRRKCRDGTGEGIDDLCRGELSFFQADIHEAECSINRVIEKAGKYHQHEIVSRALFFIMRIAVFQGDYTKLNQALKESEKQLAHKEYSSRFLTYDIVSGWYYSLLEQPEKMPNWLKEKFTTLSYANNAENFGNYIKVRHYYLKRDYTDLLPYLERKSEPGTNLYERVESLLLKACVYFKMSNTYKAFFALWEAYEVARPNGIVAPFIELGKDMRTLLYFVTKCPDCAIPRPWLKSIQHRVSAYARNQALMISRYKKQHGMNGRIALSPREKVILNDLCAGLSRSDAAAKHALSINTVKLHINSIYSKLGARNRADMLRIASEDNLINRG